MGKMSRAIELTVDVESGTTSLGVSVIGSGNRNLVLTRPDVPELRLTLQKADGTAYVLTNAGPEEYWLGIGHTYGSEIANVQTADFNPGNWGDEDPTAGKIGVSLNTEAAALVTDLGSDASKVYQVQILYRSSSSDDWKTLALFGVQLRNRIASPP